jgi:malonate transporter
VWNTLQLISPIFGLALLGYAAAWIGLVDKDAIRGLSRFAFRIAIPVMLIRAMASLSLSFEWELLTTYFLGTFLVYGAGMLVGRAVFRQVLEQQAVFGFGSGFSNLVMVGIPFIQVAYGDEGLLPLYIVLSVHAPSLYLVGTSLLKIGRNVSGKAGSVGSIPMDVLKSQTKNPIVIALAIGLGLNLGGIELTGPVDTVAAMLAAAALPCTLFTLGASLSSYPLRGQLRPALGLICIKNLLHPLIVYVLAFHVFELNPLWAGITVIMAAQPMGMNAYLFAEDSEVMAPTMAAAVVLSTAASIVTLSAVLYLLS